MHNKHVASTRKIRNIGLVLLATLFFLISVMTFANAYERAEMNMIDSPFYSFTFALDPAQSVSPTYFNSGSRDIDFSLMIDAPDSASASLEVYNGSNALIWSGAGSGGELFWGYTTLTNGNNTFTIENSGSETLTFTLKLFDIPAIQAPTPTLSWDGAAAPSGLNSEIEADFPVSGLYTFDFSVSSGGRYEFLLGNDDIQRTVTSDHVITLYVESGTQTLQIVQDDGASSLVDWQVDVAYSGTAVDSLPYSKNNDDIAEEWLPIHLDQTAEVNMVITATGTADDQLFVTVFGADPQLQTPDDANISVFAGETTWATFDLPAGTSAIHLTAPNDLMSYEFEISVLPSADFSYAGMAEPDGQNSKIRLTFGASGLYDFNFGDNGRYQFLLNNDNNSHIQKTVEDSGTVTYYVPQGTHDLIIDQDSESGASWTEWSVDIGLNSTSNDTLPYAKSGGEIGGTDNDFTEEWLPISLASAATVNLAINATGDIADHFSIEVYESGSSTADFTLAQVLGSEEQWTNFDLSAGTNRLKIIADNANTGPLSYDLEISAIPTNGMMAWSGNVLDSGENASVRVNFPTSGLYRFEIDNSVGFANLVLDDNLVPLADHTPAAPEDFMNSYDIQVDAGVHEIFVIQDATYAETTWTASVASASPEEEFFSFTGTLDSGESVTPVYPVSSGSLDFNFSLTVNGDDVDLDISNGGGGTVWAGTALDGETLWGTGTLSGDNDIMLTNNGGSSADVELKFYHIPTAGYLWDGLADGAGLNSEIRVNFPTSGLYEFDLFADSGRYQFELGSEFILKTVETNEVVSYFVPAGMQSLTIVQDSSLATSNWDVSISDVGPAQDSLPYAKTGGDIGGTGNDFDTEWLPIEMGTATAVNIATTISGTSGDSVDVTVVDASDTVLGSVTVLAGEMTWMTLDLPAGTSRLKVEADGSGDARAYVIDVTAIPSASTYAWDGDAADSGANSHIRVSFPSSGIYSFDYGVDNGRYQFLVNDDYIQKTAEADGLVQYYVPAGTHDLYIDQDSTSGADWDVSIAGPTAPEDSLPYAKTGGDLGGVGNDFNEEWLPVHVGSESLVNMLITVSGAEADSVTLEVWDTVSNTVTIGSVFGTESLWATFTLPADGRVKISADGNTDVVAYDVEIIAVPDPAFSWSGTSLDGTLNSTIQMNMQAGGTYRVQGDFLEGFASLIIDPTTMNEAGADELQADIDFTVDLDAGLHTFLVQQGAGFPTSSWVYTVTLESAYAPVITSISPDMINTGTASTITINGENFLDGATVQIISGTTTIPLTNVTYVSGAQVTAVVPDTVAVGTYSVELTNPDMQVAVLPDALEVLPEDIIIDDDFMIFLPTIMNN